MSRTEITCGECGELIDEPASTPIDERKPCPRCRSSERDKRVYLTGNQPGPTSHLSAEVRHGAKGEVAPHQETKIGSVWSGERGRMVKWYRDINREANRYRERIVDPETGEVLRDVDEPLSDHRGHGSDRTNPRSADP